MIKPMQNVLFSLFSPFLCLSLHAAQQVPAFWNSYDARKEPLNTELVQEWQTGKGTVQLIHYDLGRLTGTNK